MRITGGRARGIPLASPKGEGTRPATDRMREALFSSLGPLPDGLRVADLFAGTGAYGLEAMSRGAAGGVFVEDDPRVAAVLSKNLEAVARSCHIDPRDKWQVLRRDATKLGVETGTFDLIFVDPPYRAVEAPGAVRELFTGSIDSIAADAARVCFEMPGELEPEIASWRIVRRLGKPSKDSPNVVIFERD